MEELFADLIKANFPLIFRILMQGCQTCGLRTKFGSPRNILWPAQGFCGIVQSLTSNCGLRKIVLPKKKRSSSCNYVKMAVIAVMKAFIFEKVFLVAISKNCEKISIESIDLQKKLCRV